MLTLNPTLAYAYGLAVNQTTVNRLRLRLRADWSDVPMARSRFQAAWGRGGIARVNATGWDIARQRAWRFSAAWTFRFKYGFRPVYGLRVEAWLRHPYGDLRKHALRLAVPYGMPVFASARHDATYAIASIDRHAIRLSTPWAILADASLQAVMNTPELAWRGRLIRLTQATLSCDEDSPVWIARLEIADVADFANIQIGDAITLTLGQETFSMVVDGKMLSRPSTAEQRMELTAASPLILRESPFSGTVEHYESGAVSAHAAVENLIGPVQWNLPDWIIPPGSLMLSSVTPLSAARNIVAAIGGIIESNPDGSVVCRRRHPVSIPQYGQAAVAHQMFDRDVLSTRSQIAPIRGYNRVTIANESGSAGTSADRIEFVRDANDAYQGTVRAYLASPRAVVLAHTGHPSTVIATLGETTRTETETVEFIDGQASTRYPVASITSAVWQHTDLGTVTASGQNLTSAVRGYSLLRITYTTTSLDWRVALPIDEEVQFLIVDA